MALAKFKKTSKSSAEMSHTETGPKNDDRHSINPSSQPHSTVGRRKMQVEAHPRRMKTIQRPFNQRVLLSWERWAGLLVRGWEHREMVGLRPLRQTSTRRVWDWERRGARWAMLPKKLIDRQKEATPISSTRPRTRRRRDSRVLDRSCRFHSIGVTPPTVLSLDSLLREAGKGSRHTRANL